MKILPAATLLLALSAPAIAMDVKVVGDHLIMSGPVDGTEIARFRDVAAGPDAERIKTVILRDSGGGDHWTAIRAGQYIRDMGWRTAVSGYCFSACAIMFLGGVERHFTDDKPVLQTQIGFHGSYNVEHSQRGGKDSSNQQATYESMHWLTTRSGGKVSEDMLDRLAKLEKTELVHFFDSPRLTKPGQVSVFVCSSTKQDSKKKCKPIAGADVYREGIVTSPMLIRSNDRLASPQLAPNGLAPSAPEQAK